jgi:hypothetical protein
MQTENESKMADSSDDTKKDWLLLRELVKRSYQRISELPIDVPFSINFSSLKNDQGVEIGTRLYFLGVLDNSLENTLVYADVLDNEVGKLDLNDCSALFGKATGNENEEVMQVEPGTGTKVESVPLSGKLLWKPLLDVEDKSSGDSSGIKAELSLTEKLQLERKRVMAAGLTSYEYHAAKKRILFASGGNLYYFDDDGQPPYVPIMVKNDEQTGAKINPCFCPTNADLIGYIRDTNLYACNLITGEEIALTNLAKDYPNKLMTAGLPSYVVQEEFSRYNGFWWRSNVKEDQDVDGPVEHQILFELVDESAVDQFKISTWDGGVEDYRFPRPGK